MELTFLGTGAGMPSKRRNVTSLMLNLMPERGSYWMFDCGEGTQHQALHSTVKLGKLEKLFITHLHGDHLYGIPGVLTSRSYQGGDTPLTLYGPRGLKAFVETALGVSDAHLAYPITVVELEEEGVVCDDESFTVTAARLEHRVECFGYRIVERDLPGKLLTDKLQAYGIPKGPLYGKLKEGGSVQLENGTIVHGRDVIGTPVRGRTVVILGDTKYCEGALRLAHGADVLVHEATFAQNRQELALAYDHSTSVDAARVANEAGAGTLILTHISSRYQEEGADALLREAQELHPDTHLAQDFWSYHVPRKSPNQ
ncbi:ribonuclease Z [Gordoniibacillus kamchatkensis]|uniref:Ribonuclease Z n=1 Tax=Gordoniibacillus kamchatkensis TaxID=1590651 RepID=A0ABR5AET4_9BACL|nr:ribonuclease Z [Paenibacillus sp. VKM B-2647]KIL39529.1 ribonuclease Z [Paenibacillus sp. VKM B-2647]